ncbi:hypothetical protein [Cellulomonas sp. C5510]|uniref:hypothetical protein n=1 Tax=Cellulomonas sp. C5510 TaxID=2871170 RepID=UPI001C939FE9|nr:hypothetical protein [Cellulomonas sp. C5510]QZN86882.1 hypothetical protein K5O09_07165 [Cellulomonas sp. C5510]
MEAGILIDTGGIPLALRAAAVAVDANLTPAVYRTGAAVRTKVRANASSARHPNKLSRRMGHIPGTGPGPNVGTGDYRRSIAQDNSKASGVAVSTVYTNAPQGPRLEYGFVGADSLGRVYHQPPYPHWRPAIAEVPAILTAEAEAAVSAGLRAYLSPTTVLRRLT